MKIIPTHFALWAALPMAQTSKIEGRIAMILDSTRRRTLPRRALVFSVALGVAALVPLAMLRPAVHAQAGAAPRLAKPMSKATARVSAVHAVPGEIDAYQTLAAGGALTPAAAAALETTLAAKPDDYATHLQLLGYYQRRKIQNDRLVSAPAEIGYQQQVFWIIRKHPESVLAGTPETTLLKRDAPAAFEEGKALWLGQIAKQPNNAAILGNAAAYCLLSDDATTERLLQQAEALEPKSPIWPSKLGQLYRLQGEGPMPSPAILRQSAKKALVEYEAAASLANKTAQPNTSADLSKTAFDAGEYDKARTYAEALLLNGQKIAEAGKDDPRTPEFIFNENDNDIHEANLVLGRLALHDGDVAGAEACLLAMGRVSGSSQLDSFGPNMQLAADLLQLGKRDTVLAYFDECAKFWKDQRLGKWRSEVELGKMPDFQGNLVY